MLKRKRKISGNAEWNALSDAPRTEKPEKVRYRLTPEDVYRNVRGLNYPDRNDLPEKGRAKG